jgi:hypothetical protein
VRYAPRTLAAAIATAGAAVGVALLSAIRLGDAPARGRLAGPDPVGSIASLVALVVGLVAFGWLGRSIAVDATGARPAIVAGALGGALAGLVSAAAQSFALADYLGAVLTGYAVPPEFLAFALGAYAVLATLAAAVVGAAITYGGWHRGRRRVPQPTG